MSYATFRHLLNSDYLKFATKFSCKPFSHARNYGYLKFFFEP
jgi:hypothetical protein